MSSEHNKTLAELQASLQDFLLDKNPDANDLTLETPAFSRQERLAIYYNAYRLRLIDTLGNDYPALKFYLGDDNFEKLAIAFIDAHPSYHHSLRWFGEKLFLFLRDHDTWKEKIHVIELAEFEWAQITAFDAADAYLITIDDLKSLAPEDWMMLQLKFHTSVQILNFLSNAPEQWASIIKNEKIIATVLSPEVQTWLVWREELQVTYRPLDKPEAWALTAFLASNKFADVCEGLCEWFDEEKVPLQTVQYLQQWIQGGLIVKIC
ncbi:MAG: DUF2063 domain-containing protein [Gammaproteobacteria bacterium]|nr:MAG: DUF2063 domain-containing protein [Gammaproteobacteria bacterium]